MAFLRPALMGPRLEQVVVKIIPDVDLIFVFFLTGEQRGRTPKNFVIDEELLLARAEPGDLRFEAVDLDIDRRDERRNVRGNLVRIAPVHQCLGGGAQLRCPATGCLLELCRVVEMERCRLSRGTRQEESCPDSGEVIC